MMDRYRERQVMATLEIPEAAAMAARLVPGLRGLVLFCAARGDCIEDICGWLHLDAEAVEVLLVAEDGRPVPDPLEVE